MKALRVLVVEDDALIAMLLFSVLGFTLVAMGTTELTISGSWKQYSAAFYGAEAGVESAVVTLRGILAGTPTQTGNFPIMHMIGVRRSLVEQHPWLLPCQR